MAKRKKQQKRRFTRIFFDYGLHLWLIVIAMNVILFYTVHFYSIAATCLTTDQVSADNRCLYILDGKIYEKGTRAAPHQGHPCGTDITSVIPASHTGNPASYLLPNYIGDICAAPTTNTTPSPTPATATTPSAAPTAQTSITPTIAPTLATTNPTPTMPPTGSTDIAVDAGLGALALFIGGGLLFFLL